MQYYTWILSFHVVSVISWMAMLFYLPRLFVYHVENINNKDFVAVVKIQERKILYFIGHPAMLFSVLSGLALLHLNPQLIYQDWMQGKILIILLLLAYFVSLNKYTKQLSKNTCKKTGNFFRMYNEIPTLFLILIVTYVITKTFSILFTTITILIFLFISFKIFNKKKENDV